MYIVPHRLSRKSTVTRRRAVSTAKRRRNGRKKRGREVGEGGKEEIPPRIYTNFIARKVPPLSLSLSLSLFLPSRGIYRTQNCSRRERERERERARETRCARASLLISLFLIKEFAAAVAAPPKSADRGLQPVIA